MPVNNLHLFWVLWIKKNKTKLSVSANRGKKHAGGEENQEMGLSFYTQQVLPATLYKPDMVCSHIFFFFLSLCSSSLVLHLFIWEGNR